MPPKAGTRIAKHEIGHQCRAFTGRPPSRQYDRENRCIAASCPSPCDATPPCRRACMLHQRQRQPRALPSACIDCRSLMQPSRSKVTGVSSPFIILATTGARAFIMVGAPEVSRDDVHQPLGLEPDGTRHRERLAERLVIDHQRHVDGELGERAVADRPDMLEPPAELIEDRLGQRGIAWLRAHEAEQLALPRRARGAADRTLDKTPRRSRARLCKRDLARAAPCSSR